MIVDSHVHLMPDRLGRAIRAFFDEHIDGPLAYPADCGEVLRRHCADGVQAVWNLPYAHKPGMSEGLNAAMAEVADEHGHRGVSVVTGATTHPADRSPGEVIRKAHEAHGARVVKLHCSVGDFAIDDPRLGSVFSVASTTGMPVVVHVGRSVDGQTAGEEIAAIGRVADRHPENIIIVAHCGHLAVETTLDLMDARPNVWADVTPVVTSHPDLSNAQLARYSDRLLLGSDAPNTAITVSAQIEWLSSAGLDDGALANILGGNANRLLGA